MKAVPYLNFQSNCREAMEFYAETFGGKVAAMYRFGDMPSGDEGCAPGNADLIMHARVEFADGALMASDCPPEMGYEPAKGMWVSLHPSSIEDGERIFNALAEGGTVAMPYSQTFWAQRFGMVTDRFGTPWMINVE